MMKRIVSVVQVVALLAAVVFVVLLFANEPDTGAPTSGATVFADRCSGCHGPKGEGGVGPSLQGVAERFPDVAGQIAVVTNGRGTMPAWASRLSAEEIAAVVAYTRTGL